MIIRKATHSTLCKDVFWIMGTNNFVGHMNHAMEPIKNNSKLTYPPPPPSCLPI